MADKAVAHLHFTGDLREMLAALEVIQQFMENAEMRQLSDALALEQLTCARQAAYRVMDIVDELQDTRPPVPATVCMKKHAVFIWELINFTVY
jgi:RIO-like serine/threonine protein kinase